MSDVFEIFHIYIGFERILKMITYELALVIGFVVLCIFIITALLLKLKGIILSYPKENQKYDERLNKKAELPQQFSFFTLVC